MTIHVLQPAVCVHFAVDLPTDIEMSKVVADLEYVLAGDCGLEDDADVNIDDNVASNAFLKVCSAVYHVV